MPGGATPSPRSPGRFRRAVHVMSVLAEGLIIAAAGPLIGGSSGFRGLGDPGSLGSDSMVMDGMMENGCGVQGNRTELLGYRLRTMRRFRDVPPPAGVSFLEDANTHSTTISDPSSSSHHVKKNIGGDTASVSPPEMESAVSSTQTERALTGARMSEVGQQLAARVDDAKAETGSHQVSEPNGTPSVAAPRVSQDMIEDVKQANATGIDPALLHHIHKLQQTSHGQEMDDLLQTLATNVDAQTERKNTESSVILRLARERKYPSFLNHLKHGHYDINAYDDHNRTVLHYAIINNAPMSVVDAIMNHPQFNVNACGATGETPLHTAASLGSLATIDRLLADPRTNINARDGGGRTPLHNAVVSDNMLVLTRLLGEPLETSAPPRLGEATTTTTGAQSLPAASPLAGSDTTKAVTADVNVLDESGMTPLELAVTLGRVHLIPTLIRHGASVTNVNHLGLSPLHTALRLADARCILALLYGIQQPQSTVSPATSPEVHPLAQRDDRGDTPLHFAVRHMGFKVLAKLVRAGAPLDAINGEGYTPLELAQQAKQSKRVLKLLGAS